MRFLSKFALLLIIISAFSIISNGNPIKIITGSTVTFPYPPQPASDYNFEGDGLKGDGTTILGSFNNSICINNCNVVGSTFNLTSQFSSGDPSLAPLGYTGRIQYLGNNYVVTFSEFSFITGNTNPLPPLTNFTNGDYTTASTDFTMSATLTLRSLSTTVPNAILQLTGSGVASIDYVFNPNRSGLDIGFVRYRYSDVEALFTTTSTPEPTPEPATMLLFATGLIGVAGFARRKLKN